MEKNALSRGQQNADCAAPNPCYSTFKLASQQPRHHQNKMQTENSLLKTHGTKSITRD